jgi:hypothetical protein
MPNPSAYCLLVSLCLCPRYVYVHIRETEMITQAIEAAQQVGEPIGIYVWGGTR